MRRKSLSLRTGLWVTSLVLSLGAMVLGQNAAAAQKSSTAPTVASAAQAIVPQLIKFSGTLTDLAGKPISGAVDVTFSLYSQQDGGTPLWYESQTVNANAAGEYTTLLGAMTATGVPMDLFTSGQARWLGVAVRGLPEQSRILLVSVPYAMTSGNSEMLGGKPAADYLLASQSGTNWTTTTAVAGATSTTNGRKARQSTTASPQSITAGGTANYLAAFVNSSGTLGNSAIYQDPTTNNIGIGTSTPTFALQIVTNAPGQGIMLNAQTYGAAYHMARAGVEEGFFSVAGGTGGFSHAAVANDVVFGAQNAASGGNLIVTTQNATGSIKFATGSSPANDTVKMTLTNAGNVGVGTTAPLASTEIAGPLSTSTPATVLDLSRGYNAGIAYLSAASFLLSNPAVGAHNTRLDIALRNANRSFDVLPDTTVMSLVSNGNVGIGTTTPAHKLDVAGEINVTSQNAGAVVGNFSGGNIGVAGNGSYIGVSGAGTNYGVFGDGGDTGYGVGAISSNVAITATGATTGIVGNNSVNGAYGELGTSVGGVAAGVYGTGIKYGVYGESAATGVVGTGGSEGVFGNSTNSSSGSGVEGTSGYIGVFGDGGNSGVYGNGGVYGVRAISSSGYAVYGTSSGTTGIYGSAATNGVEGVATTGVYGYSSTQTGVYGQGPTYGVYANGNLGASGTKSAVVALPDDRVVELYAMESPENWFEDFGSGTLRNGRVVVTLDRTFALTVNTGVGYHVFLTPKGDCEGLYVTNETASGFEVRELRGGKSNVAFDYRIVAKRRGYEKVRMDELETDHATVQAIRDVVLHRPKHRRLILPAPPKNVAADSAQLNSAAMPGPAQPK